MSRVGGQGAESTDVKALPDATGAAGTSAIPHLTAPQLQQPAFMTRKKIIIS